MEAGTIVLIINIVFFVILLIGFLTGLRRGLKRSSLHLAFVGLAILTAFFITRPIVDFVVGLTIVPYEDDVISIGQFITNSMMDVSKYSPTMAEFFTQLPTAFVSPIIFMVVLLVVQFFMWIIFMIVARIWFKTKKYEKKNGIKRHRLWGSLIGTIEALVFAVFLFMPLTSLTYTFGEIAYVTASYDSSAEIGSENVPPTTGAFIRKAMPEFALDLLDGYNTSVMGSVCHLGGFDHVIYNGLSYVVLDGEKIMWRDEVSLIVNIYNKTVVIVSKDGDLTTEDYNKLTDMSNQLLNGKFLTHVISPAVSEMIGNFDKILEDADLDEEVKVRIENVVDNVNNRIEAGTTFIKYLEDNVKVLGEISQALTENGALDEIANAKEFVDVLTYDTLSKIVPQIEKFVGLTIIEDFYGLINEELVEALQGMDEYVEIESFKDYNNFKSDLPKICEVFKEISLIKESETSTTNMLQDLVNGKEMDSKVFVNSDKAANVIRKMTQVKALEKGIVTIMQTVDDELISLISDMSDKEVLADQFLRTISTTSTPEEKMAFVEKIGLQADDFVRIARVAINADLSENIADVGAVLDVMKENVVQNNFNESTLTSDGMFNAMFTNLYKTLNGTYQDVEGNPVFTEYQKFNDLITNRADGETTDLKYYKVNYTELFADFQNAKDVADAYDKRKDTINEILSGTLTPESVTALATEFSAIINEVGADEFVGAVNVAMDILGDAGYDIVGSLGPDAEKTVSDAIDSLNLGDEVSETTLQEIKNSLNKLFHQA